MFKKFNILFIIFFILLLFSCSKTDDEISYKSDTQIALATICSIKLEESVDQEIFDNCFKILSDVENQISRTRESSYINQLNRDKKVQLNKEVFDLIKYSIQLAKISDDKFNIAMGSVIKMWDIGGENPRVPTQEELKSVNIDYNQIILDEEHLTIEIPQNMEIDLGAIGKGYAADKLIKYLKSEKINNGLINLGGNVAAIGSKDSKALWNIGLQNPNEADKIFVTLKVKDVSIVTSGTYERYFYKDGVKYHHLLDPDTKYPSNSDIISSTIIGKESYICDSLSTACFLLGHEKAIQLLKNFEGYSAIFMLGDNTIVKSDNFNYDYTLFN